MEYVISRELDYLTDPTDDFVNKPVEIFFLELSKSAFEDDLEGIWLLNHIGMSENGVYPKKNASLVQEAMMNHQVLGVFFPKMSD